MTRPRKVRPWLALVAVASAAATAAAQPVNAGIRPEADLEALQEAFTALADALRPSVVAIHAERRVPGPRGTTTQGGPRHIRLPSIGSGVVIREDGKILTNEHVVHGAGKVVVVLHDGSSYESKAVHADPRSDLAVVTVDARNLKPAVLGDLANVRQGHWAFAMGNPFDLGGDGGMVMSEGVVSAVGRRLQIDPTDSRYYGNLIQTSAAINPGNSGGPLVNIYGEVIGINTAISTRSGGNEGVGFAIPMEARTKAIISRLLRGEPVEYGFLGVVVKAPEHGRTRGATIDRVEPASPAARADLRPGDVIVEFAQTVVEDADHLVRLVGASPVGQVTKVVLLRQGKRQETQVVLAKRDMPTPPTPPAPLAWRGLQLREPDGELRAQYDLPANVTGLVITEVEADSPAARAGLKPGQVIAKVGDIEVRDLDRFEEIAPGLTKPVTLTLTTGQKVQLPP